MPVPLSLQSYCAGFARLTETLKDFVKPLLHQDILVASHHNLQDHIEFQVFPSENDLTKEIAIVQKAHKYVVGTNEFHDIPHMAFPSHNCRHDYQKHTFLHQIHKANPPVCIHFLSKVLHKLDEHFLLYFVIMSQSVDQILVFFPIVDYQIPFGFEWCIGHPHG